MAEQLRLLLGTKKGAFILASDRERRSWDLRGPFCETWPINHVTADRVTGVVYAAGGSEWFGPAVWKSEDLGESWSHSSEGLAYAAGETPLKAVWSLVARPDGLYAGVEPAGLFRSHDGGVSWSHVAGLRDHPSRPHWQPGGGGLILHGMVPHPDDPQQLWVAISAGGVFHTADGGQSWTPRNRGTEVGYVPEDQRFPEFGQCVHSLAMAAGRPDRLYQQNHFGMYRSDDGGLSWTNIGAGLPTTFGFASAAHPRDPDTLYLLPLNGDSVGRYVPDGQCAVWRTHDAGASWTAARDGLPQRHAFFGVLRRAMATDPLDPAGIYFGTNTGALYASIDEGRSWSCIAQHLPGVLSVETLVMNG